MEFLENEKKNNACFNLGLCIVIHLYWVLLQFGTQQWLPLPLRLAFLGRFPASYEIFVVDNPSTIFTFL